MTKIELKTGPWKKADLASVTKHGHKVLSTFSCGGGSSFGYKLAGFDVVGCVEIDTKIYKTYLANHNVKHPMNMSIQEFNRIHDCELPKEFFELDILDGSPPCSTFSMAGAREKKWGGEHHFREGQAKQKLDDLFFDFIGTAKKLNPKIVVAENVKGLVQGKAKGYVKQIFKGFRDAGYNCQLFLLNASYMGVPQRRERTFFIANRLGKKINLSFSEKPIPFSAIDEGSRASRPKVSKSLQGAGRWCLNHKTSEVVHWCKAVKGKDNFFTIKMALPHEPLKTQTATQRLIYPGEDCFLSDLEVIRGQTFPEDYDMGDNDAGYICGMSVPPFMMQRIANQIHEQLLNG